MIYSIILAIALTGQNSYVWTTDNHEFYVGDGSTYGGIRVIPREVSGVPGHLTANCAIVVDNNRMIDGFIVGSGSNNTTFESDGTLKMNGAATVWDDVRVPITSTKAGVSKDPGFTVFKTNGAGSQGVFAYWFDASIEEELYFTCQMPHSWNGSIIHPHVHWIPSVSGTANQKVNWSLEYSWANIGATFGNTSIISGYLHSPNDSILAASKHYITHISGITPSATQSGISSMLVCRIFRNATDAGNDTYGSDAGLLEIDFHYEMDTLGSRSELEK